MGELQVVENLLLEIAGGKVVPLRQKILEMEDLIWKLPQAKHLTKLYHHFAPGVYMRELHIPAGMLNTGAIHKYPCLNILAKGRRLTVVEGSIKEISAPHISTSPAGSKRISFTIEDCIWITVHQNPYNLTDIEKWEDRLTCKTETEYQAFLANQERAQ